MTLVSSLPEGNQKSRKGPGDCSNHYSKRRIEGERIWRSVKLKPFPTPPYGKILYVVKTLLMGNSDHFPSSPVSTSVPRHLWRWQSSRAPTSSSHAEPHPGRCHTNHRLGWEGHCLRHWRTQHQRKGESDDGETRQQLHMLTRTHQNSVCTDALLVCSVCVKVPA